MQTTIQFVGARQIDAVEELTQKKLDKLARKFNWIIRADVFFKEEGGSDGKGKVCDIRLSVPGPRIHATSNEASFEAAVAETISDLERQLKKRKKDPGK
ncbi:MAG: ribosome-associated translation inhibitor RaiA [Phaeodactylibacter sp.]|nr:ribosome-associated translation inhibitor RaiA [Phaeodactylibacter sp.]